MASGATAREGAEDGGRGMKRNGPQCDSCRRPGGVPREIDGVPVVICAECWPSDFRRQRVLERARSAS